MAKISFEDYNRYTQSLSENRNSSANSFDNSIGYFSIKDGESAIVRIMIDSPADFNMVACHNVSVTSNRTGNRYYRLVSCARTPFEPVDKCPLCASGDRPSNKIFIPMIQYVNENGNVIAKPVIWTTGAGRATDLNGFINDYGSLSDVICRITRTGTGLDTKYLISPGLNKNTYPDDVYVKDYNLFKDYVSSRHDYVEKTVEDMNVYLTTGNFPTRQNNTVATESSPVDIKKDYVEDFSNAINITSDNDIPTWSADNKKSENVVTEKQLLPWETPGVPSRTY